MIDSIFNTPFLQDACATAEALAALFCVVLMVGAVDLLALAIARKPLRKNMSEDLSLHIHDEGDLVLPSELLQASLPAGELVALIGFLAMQEEHYDFANKLLLADESGDVARALSDRGILHVQQTGNRIKIRVDLTKLPPAANRVNESR